MFSDSDMLHADIKLPKASVHAKHPFRNTDSHDKLLNYLQQRLRIGKQKRDGDLRRLVRIDRKVAGWIKLAQEDRARQIEEDRTGNPQAVKMNLPLEFVHLDDMMTYFVQTFAPSRGMFYHTGSPQDQSPAMQITTLMNNHAIYGGYYREVVKTIFAILKYQRGGFYAFWSKDSGPKLTTNNTGESVVQEQIVWQGNRIEALDEYNTFLDPSVSPVDCHRDGEFAARASLKSHYWLQSKAAQGLYYNVEDILSNDSGVNRGIYYIEPPEYSRVSNSTGNGTDWVSVLSAADSYWTGSGFELVEIFIKLNPMQMNLLPNTPENRATRSRYEIWRFTIANDTTIIDATYMNNIHGHLPYYYGVNKEDSMKGATKSVAEILMPLGSFGSFLLNAHVEATRKNLYGITYYDPTMVDMDSIPQGEVAARVPLKASGFGKDIRTMVFHDSHVLDTEQTLEDLNKLMNIINQFFPTQSLPSQIAGIDRAIDSQVAAVQQGANRRMQKDARMIDDTLFRPFRFCCYYNIIQYQPDNVSVQDFYGKQVQINLNQLRDTDLPFIIGQGLKAIDLQAAAAKLQQIIFAIIQNPTVATQLDLLGLIDYWTSMIDIDIDMTQFHAQPQQPPGTATPPIDPATGQPIAGGPPAPLVNPQAVTRPLTKPGPAA